MIKLFGKLDVYFIFILVYSYEWDVSVHSRIICVRCTQNNMVQLIAITLYRMPCRTSQPIFETLRFHLLSKWIQFQECAILHNMPYEWNVYEYGSERKPIEQQHMVANISPGMKTFLESKPLLLCLSLSLPLDHRMHEIGTKIRDQNATDDDEMSNTSHTHTHTRHSWVYCTND